MAAKDTYKSIAAQSEGLFKDNGSRFLAFAYPVESEAEALMPISPGSASGLRNKPCSTAYEYGVLYEHTVHFLL